MADGDQCFLTRGNFVPQETFRNSWNITIWLLENLSLATRWGCWKLSLLQCLPQVMSGIVLEFFATKLNSITIIIIKYKQDHSLRGKEDCIYALTFPVFVLERGSCISGHLWTCTCYIAKDDLKFLILLPPSPSVVSQRLATMSDFILLLLLVPGGTLWPAVSHFWELLLESTFCKVSRREGVMSWREGITAGRCHGRLMCWRILLPDSGTVAHHVYVPGRIRRIIESLGSA